MKKVVSLLIVLMLGTMLVSCKNNSSKEDDLTKSNNQNDVIESGNKEKPKQETKKILTADELINELNNQPLIVTKTEYIVQDPELKSLYPDMLNVIIQNNSGTDIKSAVVGFVAWDENNFPVKVVGNLDFSGGDYFVQVDYGDVNMVNGASYGDGIGFTLAKDSKISKFKAIVTAYTDFNGNTWSNPLLDDFKDLYVDKKLEE